MLQSRFSASLRDLPAGVREDAVPRSRSLLSLPIHSNALAGKARLDRLHAAPLLGAATVVGHRRVVFHRRHTQAGPGQSVDRALPPGPGPLDADLNLAHPHLPGLAAAGLRGPRRGEGRALAGALDAD